MFLYKSINASYATKTQVLSGQREDLKWPINPKYDGGSSNIMMLFGQKPLAGVPTDKGPGKGPNWQGTRQGRQ